MQVTFPLVLDCYEFCTAEYKTVLEGPRGAEALIDEHRAGISKRQRLEQAAKARRCLPLFISCGHHGAHLACCGGLDAAMVHKMLIEVAARCSDLTSALQQPFTVRDDVS